MEFEQLSWNSWRVSSVAAMNEATTRFGHFHPCLSKKRQVQPLMIALWICTTRWHQMTTLLRHDTVKQKCLLRSWYWKGFVDDLDIFYSLITLELWSTSQWKLTVLLLWLTRRVSLTVYELICTRHNIYVDIEKLVFNSYNTKKNPIMVL